MALTQEREGEELLLRRTEEAPLRTGDVLGGKYRVERVLGSGAMGVVVRAVHVELGQRVALKFLRPYALHLGETHSRFMREAKAVVQIESEHVARVLDFGRLESGAPYLVMEYLDGEDLSTRLGKPQPIGEAVDFVLQACSAMAVAHSLGIIHRDLKPANLFVTKRPDGSPLVKVLDFGISKLSVVDASVALTQASMLLGSPRYMSPEQARDPLSVDVRTDIWSLGVILYELLAGKQPFPGRSLTEILTSLVTAEPTPLRDCRSDVPPELERAVLKALEKPVDRRYANVAEFSAAIVEFAPPRSWVLHDQAYGVLARAGLATPLARPTLTPSSSTIRPLAPSGEFDTTHIAPRGEEMLPTQAAEPKKRLQPAMVFGAGALTLVALAFGAGYRTAPPPTPTSSPAELASPPAPIPTSPRKTSTGVAAAKPETEQPSLTPLPNAAPQRPSQGASPGGSPSVALVRPAAPAPSSRARATAPEPTSRDAGSPPAERLPVLVNKPPRPLDVENPFAR